MADPAGLYSRGTPGRGAGTIFTPFDAGSVLTKALQMENTKQKKEDADIQSRVAKYDKLSKIGQTAWAIDNEAFGAQRDEIMSGWADYYKQKTETGKPDFRKEAELAAKENDLLNFAANSKYQMQEFAKKNNELITLNSKDLIDDEQFDKDKAELEAWAKRPWKERVFIPLPDVAKPFDYEQYTAPLMGKAQDDGKQKTSVYYEGGRKVGDKPVLVTDKVEYYLTPAAGAKLQSMYYGDNKAFKKAADTRFSNWLSQNPSKEITVERHIKDKNGNIIRSVETLPVNNIDDYINNVEAPKYSFIRTDENAKAIVNQNISVGMPQVKEAGEPDVIDAPLTMTLPSGTATSFNTYNGTPISANNVGGSTITSKSYKSTPPKGAIKISGDDEFSPSKQYYQVFTDVKDVPTLTQSVNFGGEVIPAGTPVPVEYEADAKKRGISVNKKWTIISMRDINAAGDDTKDYTVAAPITSVSNVWKDPNYMEMVTTENGDVTLYDYIMGVQPTKKTTTQKTTTTTTKGVTGGKGKTR